MLSNKKAKVEKYFEPLAKFLSKTNPNILTLIGSIPPLLFFVFLINHFYVLAIIAYFGTIIDIVDGMIARKYNKVSSFGGFLDSTIDRIGDFFIITAFAFSGLVKWEIVAPLLLFSYLTSYTRSRGELASLDREKVKFNIGLIERPERLFLTLFSLIAYLLLPGINFSGLNITELVFIMIAVLSLYTVIQRIIYAYKVL